MMRRAGIVEGFFSAPLPTWSFEDRAVLLDFAADFAPALNSYFYCPKDDPFVTRDWSALYPPDWASAIAVFIRACRSRGVEFVYGFNPEVPGTKADSLQGNSWINAIGRKVEQLQSLGCTGFCLLFDDVPLSYDAVEKHFDEMEELAFHFVEFATAAAEAVRARDVEVWICSPDYCFCHESPLTMRLQNLSGIPMIWTGRGVFVPRITSGDLAAARNNIGQDARFVVWSNYPVNDVEQNVSVLNLGGFVPPDREVLEEVDGIFVNCMRQCFANLPFLASFSEYLIAPDSYERDGVWNRSLHGLLGAELEPCHVLFDQFSSCNVVDKAPKFMFARLSGGWRAEDVVEEVERALSTLQRAAPATVYGARFLAAVGRIETEARRFVRFGRAMLLGHAIAEEDFIAEDSFPTVPGAARNLEEIAQIVAGRIGLTPARLPEAESVLDEAAGVVAEFGARYRGSARLAITRADEVRYAELIARLVGAEQRNALACLNRRELDPLERLRRYALRQSTNRFTAKRPRRVCGPQAGAGGGQAEDLTLAV